MAETLVGEDDELVENSRRCRSQDQPAQQCRADIITPAGGWGHFLAYGVS